VESFPILRLVPTRLLHAQSMRQLYPGSGQTINQLHRAAIRSHPPYPGNSHRTIGLRCRPAEVPQSRGNGSPVCLSARGGGGVTFPGSQIGHSP